MKIKKNVKSRLLFTVLSFVSINIIKGSVATNRHDISVEKKSSTKSISKKKELAKRLLIGISIIAAMYYINTFDFNAIFKPIFYHMNDVIEWDESIAQKRRIGRKMREIQEKWYARFLLVGYGASQLFLDESYY